MYFVTATSEIIDFYNGLRTAIMFIKGMSSQQSVFIHLTDLTFVNRLCDTFSYVQANKHSTHVGIPHKHKDIAIVVSSHGFNEVEEVSSR